jgi:hypothetical protein
MHENMESTSKKHDSRSVYIAEEQLHMECAKIIQIGSRHQHRAISSVAVRKPPRIQPHSNQEVALQGTMWDTYHGAMRRSGNGTAPKASRGAFGTPRSKSVTSRDGAPFVA